MKKPLHILMLEDNPTDLELLQHLLMREMKQVRFSVATNKAEFIERLNAETPDVILADHGLPGFNSTQALFIVQQRSLAVPFILVTGTVSEEFASIITKLGASDYILKDRPARLPAAIEAAIKQSFFEKEKEQAHINLIKSEQRYRTLIERITDAFIAFDSQWRYTYLNEQAGVLIRRDPKSMIGKNIWTEFPDFVGSASYVAYHEALNDQRAVYIEDYYPAYDLWTESNIYPSAEGISIFIRDISVRKKADEEIHQMNSELRELSSYLQNIREQERIRISREIHDELGQQLTGLKMDMHWLQKKVPAQDASLREKINSAVTLIDETVKSVRRIASELRPSMLDDLGLIAALEWHAGEVKKRADIEVSFNSPLTIVKLSLDVATGIFRIYQELLTNAIRHSNARTIVTSLTRTDNALQLMVKDDGRGMDMSASAKGKTLGWLGIKERTYILGGTIEYESEKGKGTDVRILIPFSDSEH